MTDTSFCEHCGAALGTEAKFCEECGEPVKNAEVAAAVPVAAPAPVPPAVRAAQAQPAPRVQVNVPQAKKPAAPRAAKAPKKKPSPWLWVGLGAGLVALVVCVGVALFAATRLLPGGLNLPGIAAGLGEKTSPRDGIPLVNVPAGKFNMGFSSADIANVMVIYNGMYPTADWKIPTNSHTITLDSFWIDKTEVTNGMYGRCVQQGACLPPADLTSKIRNGYYGYPTYDAFPVIHVTWQQAVDYCQWAGRRLPSAAEWEKAARGTDGRSYPWGKSTSFDCTQANFKGCQGDTEAVGSHPAGASPYGALDMEGNVEEWVADWNDSEYWKISPPSNPPGPATGTVRAVRGASWFDEKWGLVIPFEDAHKPGETSSTRGFRCAVTGP